MFAIRPFLRARSSPFAQGLPGWYVRAGRHQLPHFGSFEDFAHGSGDMKRELPEGMGLWKGRSEPSFLTAGNLSVWMDGEDDKIVSSTQLQLKEGLNITSARICPARSIDGTGLPKLLMAAVGTISSLSSRKD